MITHRLLILIVAATLPLAACTVNLGSDAGSDGTTDTSGDGDGDTVGDGDGDTVGDGDGDTEGCPDGTLDCPCYGNDTCNPGLECNAGICEPAPGDGDGDGDPTGDGDGDGDPTGDGDGDGDGDVVDLTGWTKKRDIIIENQWVAPLDDYQTLMVLDYDADMQIDFEDLRFTNEADDTFLPFWVEEFTPPVNVTLFVRVPNLPVGQSVTIHMYYGNPNATSASDGTTTFDFFDDFDGPNLDESIWSTTAAPSFQPDYIHISAGAIFTDDFVMHDVGRIEAKQRLSAGLVVGRQQGVQAGLGTLSMYLGGGNWLASAYEMGMEYFNNVNIGPGDYNSWNHIGIATINGQIIFFRNRDSASSFNVDFPGDFFVIMGHPYGSDAGQMPWDGDVDFVLRRGYAAVEPDYMVGVEENF